MNTLIKQVETAAASAAVTVALPQLVDGKTNSTGILRNLFARLCDHGEDVSQTDTKPFEGLL
ncbi:MAG: hypothetical protein ABJM29_07125 [Rhizobiaceae bacterium]